MPPPAPAAAPNAEDRKLVCGGTPSQATYFRNAPVNCGGRPFEVLSGYAPGQWRLNDGPTRPDSAPGRAHRPHVDDLPRPFRGYAYDRIRRASGGAQAGLQRAVAARAALSGCNRAAQSSASDAPFNSARRKDRRSPASAGATRRVDIFLRIGAQNTLCSACWDTAPDRRSRAAFTLRNGWVNRRLSSCVLLRSVPSL